MWTLHRRGHAAGRTDHLIEHTHGVGALDLTPLPFSLVGVAIGIFWDSAARPPTIALGKAARCGGVVNYCRSGTRQILTMLQSPPEEQADLQKVQKKAVYMLIAFIHALRHHLRDSEPWEDLAPLMSAEELENLKGQRNVPTAILQRLGHGLANARRRGWLHELHVPTADNVLTELTTLQGGCERIRNTPVPYVYAILSHRVVAAFCFFSPSESWMTSKATPPSVTALVSYAFFSLDSLGAEIEEPFGHRPPRSAALGFVPHHRNQSTPAAG